MNAAATFEAQSSSHGGWRRGKALAHGGESKSRRGSGRLAVAAPSRRDTIFEKLNNSGGTPALFFGRNQRAGGGLGGCSHHTTQDKAPGLIADRIAAVIFAVFAVVAALLLSSCAGMQQAYATYDATFEREMVMGHDSVRGDYVEYRVKPRRADTTNRTDRTDGKAVVTQ